MSCRPDNVYHVTVMPCYDKKLEAARDDFTFTIEGENGQPNSVMRIAEVDSVLTTGEVLDLIQVGIVDGKTVLKFALCYGFRNLQNIVRKIKMGKCDYHFIEVEVADPFDNPVVQRLYDEWLGQPGSGKAKRYLHTEYHPLVKSAASQLHNW
ncbi:hypothetical protein BHE74_00009894 [Ensete ventricosum]|nr:hypothetical protein GW17_00025821 [Ensete ventricosum]RWW81693.1 hypothetical protein BHE74_00009894 [Ensete ventricosum]RZR98504.1 hypothetical protein BHM03_00027863 [Ensete ventricosum]